jgi:hypothetical protein
LEDSGNDGESGEGYFARQSKGPVVVADSDAVATDAHIRFAVLDG